jgi:hypothetical protein
MDQAARVAREWSPSGAGAAGESFEALLARIERDASRHSTAGPTAEDDLLRLERAVGHPLPAPFRTFLARVGGGLYYERHEIFGPKRAMIHDIELVPPLAQVCRGLPAGVIPIHRVETVIHFMDLRQADPSVPVFSLVSGERYRDFAGFLEAVVVPSGDAMDGPS